MVGVKAHTSELATALIDRAGEILSVEGPAALSLRRLARDAGTTTMAVYTLFGDKQGLLAAMFRAGFDRLAATLAEAVDDDPLTTLANLGLAYRRAALANPHLYALMFGQPAPELSVDEATETAARATYDTLVDAVAACVAAGVMTGQPPVVAAQLWALSHGLVSLEIAGQLPDVGTDADTAYRNALTLVVLPFLADAAGAA